MIFMDIFGLFWAHMAEDFRYFSQLHPFFFFSDSEVVIIMSWGVPVVQFQSPLEAVLDSVPPSDPFPWVPWASADFEISTDHPPGDPPSGKDGGW